MTSLLVILISRNESGRYAATLFRRHSGLTLAAIRSGQGESVDAALRDLGDIEGEADIINATVEVEQYGL